MNKSIFFAFIVTAFGLAGCAEDTTLPMADLEADAAFGDYERGPRNGRMLRDGDFALELAIFEDGFATGVSGLGQTIGQ